MIVLQILTVLNIIAMFIVNPSNMLSWVSIFTNMSFVLRPFGIHVPVKKIISVEALLGFIIFNGSLVFRSFDIKKYLIMIFIRCIFYLIVYYDDTQFVYVQEEEEKEI